jgi:nucleotide-binding universal stress UspA family protein
MSSTLASPTVAPRTPPRTRKGPVMVAVGADGSNVLRTAAALVPVVGERLHVFSAVEPLSAEIFGGEPVILPAAFEEERRAERVEHLAARIADAAGPGHRWQMEIELGEPATEIVRRARELDASLILMGIGKHKPIDRLFAGETTLRVIRRASCPVLAVVGALEHPPREVVVATDFSPESALAAECAAALLPSGAVLRLVHVWEPSHSANMELHAIERRYAESLPERFERFAAALDVPAGVTVAFETREGKTVPQLLESAESHGADMIVAGRHGLSQFARLFIGSVTTAIVRAANCAVLVSPEADFAQLDRWQRVLTGTSASASPGDWPRQLAEFTRRNRGRRTALEVDDPSIGAQTQEIGYALLGASYDPNDARAELMLGLPLANSPHLTRSIGGVDSIAVLTSPTGADLGLRISHGEGQTLLTFPGAS